MKYTLTTTVIALAMSATANAANTTTTPTLWSGDMFITVNAGSTAGACGGVGIATGDVVQAIFAPKALSGNASLDHFSLFFRRGSAIQIVPTSGTLSSTQIQSATITVIDGIKTKNKSTTIPPFTVTPSTISTSTPWVTISFQIAGFLATGCNVTFNGAVGPRPGSWPSLVN